MLTEDTDRALGRAWAAAAPLWLMIPLLVVLARCEAGRAPEGAPGALVGEEDHVRLVEPG